MTAAGEGPGGPATEGPPRPRPPRAVRQGGRARRSILAIDAGADAAGSADPEARLNGKFMRNGIVMLVLVVGTVALLYTFLMSSPSDQSVAYSQFLHERPQRARSRRSSSRTCG